MESIINTANQLGIYYPKLIAQTINFGIILFILWKFAYRPVLKLLAEREEKIAAALENADKIKSQLADAEAKRKEIIHKANEQANAMIAEAQKTAAAQGEKKLQEAVSQAEDVIKRAREASVMDRDKLMVELKREVGRLVIDTTSKVTGKVLNDSDQQRLKDETAQQLAASN